MKNIIQRAFLCIIWLTLIFNSVPNHISITSAADTGGNCGAISSDLSGSQGVYNPEFAAGGSTGGFAITRCTDASNTSFNGCYMSSCPSGWTMTDNKYPSKATITSLNCGPGQQKIDITITCSNKWNAGTDKPVDCGNNGTCSKCINKCLTKEGYQNAGLWPRFALDQIVENKNECPDGAEPKQLGGDNCYACIPKDPGLCTEDLLNTPSAKAVPDPAGILLTTFTANAKKTTAEGGYCGLGEVAVEAAKTQDGTKVCAFKCEKDVTNCNTPAIVAQIVSPWVSRITDNNGLGKVKTLAEAECNPKTEKAETILNPENAEYACAVKCVPANNDCGPVPTAGGPWTAIVAGTEPSCTAPKKAEFAYSPAGKKCFFKCACDDTKKCPAGQSLTGGAGCTPGAPQKTDCGTAFQCYTCPPTTGGGSTDVCVGKENKYCGGGADWIDCKGCVAGSKIDTKSNGSISPSPAKRLGFGNGCSATSGYCYGNPSIKAKTAEGQDWTSQDYCKIYQKQSVKSSLLRTDPKSLAYFTCEEYDKNNTYYTFLGGNGGADAICTGCEGQGVARNFMSGPFKSIASAPENAGCQAIRCDFKKGNEMVGYIAGETCDSSSCGGGYAAGRAYLPLTACSNGTTFKTTLTGNTCSWKSACEYDYASTHPYEYCTGINCGNCDEDGNNCDYAETPTSTSSNPYKMDYVGESCSGTEQLGRQIQGAYKILKKDLDDQTFEANKCDVNKDFKILFNKDNACKQEVTAAPATNKYLPSALSTDSFNPCTCKAKEYTVEYTKNGLSFTNVEGECIMRYKNDPARGSDYTDMAGSGYAKSNGYFKLTEAVDDSGKKINGKDINGWVWDQGKCRFTCGGCDDSALCYGKPPAYGDIEFIPDQRSTATYEYKDESNCEQSGHKFDVHFNTNTPSTNTNKWKARSETNTKTTTPFNYHEWIINRANTGRNDYLAGDTPNSDKLYSVQYSRKIGGSDIFFRNAMVNGVSKCAVRLTNDPQENSEYAGVKGSNYAKSDGFFTIKAHPDNADTFWQWSDETCQFEYQEVEETKCFHQDRVAKALIEFEPDHRLNAAYVYDSDLSCGDSDEEIQIVFNDRSAPSPQSPWTVKTLKDAKEKTNYYHELIVNQICTGANDFGVSRGGTSGLCDSQTNNVHTVDYYYKGQRFAPNPAFGGACTVDWFKNPDSDGVYGFNDKWGEASKNGHLTITEHTGGLGYQANNASEWSWDATNCRFVFNRPQDSQYGVSMSKCEQKPLEAVARIEFTPDLRVVVYNDRNYTTSINSSLTKEGSEVGLKCSPNGLASTYGTATYENVGLIGDALRFKQNDKIKYRSGSLRDNNSKVWNKDIINDTPGVEGGDLKNNGHFFTMYLGENISRNPASPYILDLEMNNAFDKENDAYYLDCVCPTLPDRDSKTQATVKGLTGNCSYNYTPDKDIDICTTKRFYVAERYCYTSPWWQISGGNVYAQNNIIDSVPPNSTDSLCGSEPEKKCEDVEPAANTGYVPDFSGGNALTNYNEVLANKNGDNSCTPRIIRGRTPCKNDGPSNSAGIALSYNGIIEGVDRGDYYTQSVRSEPDELAKRITERANIHALYSGNYGNNSSNKTGLQAKIAGSKVGPKKLSAFNDVKPNTGYKPNVSENFNYFVNLAGGINTIKAKTISNDSDRDGSKTLKELIDDGKCNLASTNNESASTYICYIEGDLVIKQDKPWHVQAKSNTSTNPADKLKVTVFVDGDLTLAPQSDKNLANASNQAVTAVDIGNYLGFVVKKNIIVKPEVGVNMPNPKDMPAGVDLLTCWEKQSADLAGNNYSVTSMTNPAHRSAAGVVEGIFIADGNLTVERYQDLSTCGQPGQVYSDKRFIAQGSFAVWGSVKFLRDFNQRDRGCEDDTHGVYNNRVPTETFIYRPDLVKNIPYWMRRTNVYYEDITGKGR